LNHHWQSLTLFANSLPYFCVKAVTINISLNPELADFARADSEAGAFDSMSEYMRELIRQRRAAKIAEDVATLEKAITGAPAGEPTDEQLQRIYAIAKKGRRK
jgi:Arc/MetJ-type ribon-helix-helix transcriptional regulator